MIQSHPGLHPRVMRLVQTILCQSVVHVIPDQFPVPPRREPPPNFEVGSSSRPRWVSRPVSAVRDFPPGCGHTFAPACGHSASRPPVPPASASGASSSISYHVHQAVDRSFIREHSPDLAAHLDQIPVAPPQGVPAPTSGTQGRVRALTRAAVERARMVDPFASPASRALQYQSLVDWMVLELGSIGDD